MSQDLELCDPGTLGPGLLEPGQERLATNPLVFHNPYATGNGQDQCAAVGTTAPKCKVAGGIYFIFIKDVVAENAWMRLPKWEWRAMEWVAGWWWFGGLLVTRVACQSHEQLLLPLPG